MTPAPSTRHQQISIALASLLFAHFKGHSRCRPYAAPTDLVLSETDVVQPDLMVICDPDQIKEKHISGPPDLIFEITSPSTEVRDRREKRILYEGAGVPEYIVIFQEREYAERYLLKDDRYGPAEIFNWDEVLVSGSHPELPIPLWEIMEKNAPKTSPP